MVVRIEVKGLRDLMVTDFNERARRLRNALEPVVRRAALARLPGSPMGDLWRAADLVREHRGDSHVISWAVGGADAVEVL
jgi:hypothetical protein